MSPDPGAGADVLTFGTNDVVIQSLSLCSGIGMLDEGLRTGCDYLGWTHRCLGYCERDAYATAVLLARMEDASLEQAPVWCGDLAELDAKPLRGWANAITAGFPCQPWSAAGKQQGTDDERWLWPAIVRIIVDLEPRIVFLENVPGLISGGGIEHVLSDLAAIGFDAEWLTVSAAEVGASHKRERVFILAYASGQRRQQDAGGPHADEGPDEGWAADAADQLASGIANVVHTGGKRRKARDAPVQRCGDQSPARQADDAREGRSPVGHAERDGGRFNKPGRREDWGGIAGRTGAAVADSSSPRPQERGRKRCDDGAERAAPERNSVPLFAPGPGDFDGWGRVVADGSFDLRAPAVKPGVRVLVDGNALVVDASRADQLRCGGNSVVALQAAVAFVELVRRSHRLLTAVQTCHTP